MFTGIVEETGVIKSIKPSSRSIALTLAAGKCGRGVRLGDSVAVNGCCLTVVKISPSGKSRRLRFDLLQESWQLTNLQFAQPGSLVNLERSLRANGSLGGHFVTGHVDGLGRIIRWEKSGADQVLEISAPAAVLRYLVPKGSIAVDGMSLTVAAVGPRSFRIWIIPHTLAVTALRERQLGDAVNLEVDLLGKYVERFLAQRTKK